MRNYQVADVDVDGTTSNFYFLPTMNCFLEYFNPVSDRPYDWADTEIEIHRLRFWNAAHKFGAGEYIQTIDMENERFRTHTLTTQEKSQHLVRPALPPELLHTGRPADAFERTTLT
jgi:hypothetical protein